MEPALRADERLNSLALCGFMRKVRWNDGLALGVIYSLRNRSDETAASKLNELLYGWVRRRCDCANLSVGVAEFFEDGYLLSQIT